MSQPKYYRNPEPVISDQGVEIDPGSLWVLNENLLVLVDDDEYHTHSFDADLFTAEDL